MMMEDLLAQETDKESETPLPASHDVDESDAEEDGSSTQRIIQPKEISVYDMLNVKYLNRIAITIFVQEFIIAHRLHKIQRFYRRRHAQRVKAAKQISLRVRLFLS